MENLVKIMGERCWNFLGGICLSLMSLVMRRSRFEGKDVAKKFWVELNNVLMNFRIEE